MAGGIFLVLGAAYAGLMFAGTPIDQAMQTLMFLACLMLILGVGDLSKTIKRLVIEAKERDEEIHQLRRTIDRMDETTRRQTAAMSDWRDGQAGMHQTKRSPQVSAASTTKAQRPKDREGEHAHASRLTHILAKALPFIGALAVLGFFWLSGKLP